MVTSQSSDRASLKWLRQWYTVYGFRFHGSLRGREIADNTDDIQTSSGTRSLRILALSDTDYCIILLVLGEWQYRIIVLITQHLTCVALINILLPSPHSRPTSPAEWQYKASFQPVILNAGRVCDADQKTEISNQSIFICDKKMHARTELIPSLDVLRFSAFLICVHCVRQVGNRP